MKNNWFVDESHITVLAPSEASVSPDTDKEPVKLVGPVTPKDPDIVIS